MLARSLLRSCVATISILVLGSHAANAACVINGVRPTVPLPTMAAGQEFSFLASADCETLRFRVPGTRFAKTPRPGSDTGPRPRTYKVALTESEWDSLVDDGDTTFRWSIIGTTSAGVTTRVTTTNAMKDDAGVTIDLSTADAKLVGEGGGRVGDQAGSSVSGAGDVDGDGHDDLLIGAPGHDEGGTQAGAAYLVLGPVTGTVDLSMAEAKLVGEERFDGVGLLEGSVSGAGDVDADGHDDLLVGAVNHTDGGVTVGAAYVVLGPVSGTLDLSFADAKLMSEAGSDAAAGWSVSGAGDVNGDGCADVLVGAPNADDGVDHQLGAAYLVLGPVSGTLDLSLADAKLVGEETSSFNGAGRDVAGAGDMDADGHDDLLVGAASAAYLVLGPVTGTLDLSMADAKLVGAGRSVSGGGDVDGDGNDDLLLGAGDDVCLFLGPVAGTLDLSVADAKLLGEGHDDFAGSSVSSAGDIDADGHADILVGAFGNDEGGFDAGAAYVVLGPVTGTLELSDADAKIAGEERRDWAGYSVSGAGDIDADGHADILVGALFNGDGAAYVLYGGGL